MLLRFPYHFRVLAVLAVISVISGCSYADDPATVKQLQETVAKLEKKIADLEAKMALLEKQGKVDPGTKPDKNDDEYVKAMVGAALESMLAGDVVGLHTKLSMNLLKGINGTFDPGSNFHNSEIEKWIKKWNPELKYKSYMIDKIVYSPAKDEAVLTGTLSGTVITGALTGTEGARASFTLTLVKDKDKGDKFLIDGISVKAK